MKQVKFFLEKSCDEKTIEKKVNSFLAENDGKIKVIDVKFNASPVHADRNEWQIYTVVVVYDTVKE